MKQSWEWRLNSILTVVIYFVRFLLYFLFLYYAFCYSIKWTNHALHCIALQSNPCLVSDYKVCQAKISRDCVFHFIWPWMCYQNWIKYVCIIYNRIKGNSLNFSWIFPRIPYLERERMVSGKKFFLISICCTFHRELQQTTIDWSYQWKNLICTTRAQIAPISHLMFRKSGHLLVKPIAEMSTGI